MPALPETIYNPDEKYQHPEPGNLTRVPTEDMPPAPTPMEQQEPIKQKAKETIQVPTSLVRWVCYTLLFAIILTPFASDHTLTVLQMFSVAAILGHFAGQLNKLIDK